MADFGVVSAAAPRGGGRANAARAAANNTPVVKPTGGKATGGKTTGGQNSGGQSGAGKTTGNNQKASGVKPNGARAAATQKVLNTGTKIATKTENTVIPKECQDAYYGCMDQFCMLENTSGGRCQCSDRSKDLNPLLDEITKIDQIAYTMATEGVERLQMGENAEQVIAMAKAAGSKVSSTDNSLGIRSADQYANEAGKNRKTTRKTLDLSAFTVGAFEDDDDIFGDDEASEAEKKAATIEDTLASKVGDDLRSESNKICVPLLPKQCVDSASMLQLAYAQKIKSDCNAYENSLKQQKIASNQKLAAAEKALREAALESFEKENKYELGPCITEFTKCIQQDNVCGEDYTGCTTLSAKDNVKARKGQKTTIPGSTVQISVSTMEAIMAAKPMCEHITKQCVKANKNDAVWTAFLKSVAPALKSAEELAEEKLRMECIPNVADCFQKACAQKFDPKAKEANYDSCLSDPTIVRDLCKVKLEPCLEATGGTFDNVEKSSLWNGVLAALGAMRVDACTSEVKACLTSDDACGKDYSGCVGLGTQDIVSLCPTDKLTACMTKNNGDENEVRKYVDKVAQGIALNIDNNMMATCQAAVKTAMTTYCGDENSCSNVKIPQSNFKQEIQVKFCDATQTTDGPEACKETLSAFGNNDIVNGNVIPRIVGVSELAALEYLEEKNDKNITGGPKFVVLGDTNKGENQYIQEEDIPKLINLDYTKKSVSNLSLRIMAAMNSAMKMKIQEIENDPKVSMCMKGRDVQKTDGKKMEGTKNKRFPNLTQSARTAIAEALHQQALDIYEQVMQDKRENDLQKARDEIAKKMEELGAKEEAQDQANAADCKSMYAASRDTRWMWRHWSTKATEGRYNKDSNICTEWVKEYSCSRKGVNYCYKWPAAESPTSEHAGRTTQMKQVAAITSGSKSGVAGTDTPEK